MFDDFEPNEAESVGPPPPEAIDWICQFFAQVIEHADTDGVLMDALANWEPGRQVAYEQAIYLYNAALGE